MSSDEIVDVVDAENRVIRRATRGEVRAKNLPHRGVGILCRDPAGRIYVHRRTRTKDVFPGLYDMFVGGVVGSGESYDDAARREVAEELGIVGTELRFLFHHHYVGPQNHAFIAVYEVTWDGPMRHQESEVEWGAFLDIEEVVRSLARWEYVPDGVEIFERYRESGSGLS
jgi:isopentenyldiphosphate isomerase